MARDNAPPPDGWTCEPRPWSERRCCSTCESPQHAVFMHGERDWMNVAIAAAELDPRGTE